MPSEQIKKVYLADQACVLGPESITPQSIENVLEKTKFGINCDIWKIADKYLIGDNYPTFNIEIESFPKERIIYNAQNYDAFSSLYKEGYHVYCRSKDDLVVTSKGIVLCFGSTVLPVGISMNPEHVPQEHLDLCFGICSKFIGAFSNATRNNG